MKTWLWASLALTLALGGAAWSQEGPPQPPKPDDKFRPEKPEEAEEEDLTPEKAMAMLKEARGLMAKSEELLHHSSRGKALETEEEIVKKINDLLKDDPAAAQKQILQRIEKLLGKSEGSQKETVEKINEIIRKAKACQGGSCPKPGEQQKPGQQQKMVQKPQNQPGSPANSPYDPNRQHDPMNKFRSTGDRTGRWGDLPPRLREAMLSGKRDIDDFPPEYQQILTEYFKVISGGNQ